MTAWCRACARRACRKPPSRWCRRATARRSGCCSTGLNGAVDVIVPRGGKSLVARVEAEARVPVFAHLEGVNHVYVDRAANLDMAKSIVLNAKMRRTGVCGAAETLLVDRAARGHKPQAAGRDADRGRLRGARRRRRAACRQPREARLRARTGTPNISTPSSPRAWSTASTARSRISTIMARIIPMRS